MVAQNPSDQQDTVVLSRPELAGPPSATTHDTMVLGLPDPAQPGAQPGAHLPDPAQPGTQPGEPVTRGMLPPAGWQAVSEWRTAMIPRAPTAWSHVPPFIQAGPPVIVMRNNAAVVGATLGSVALFLSLLPLVGIVAWVLAPIGLVTSAAGLFVGMTRRVGRVGALWGVATSALALIICLAWTALLLAL